MDIFEKMGFFENIGNKLDNAAGKVVQAVGSIEQKISNKTTYRVGEFTGDAEDIIKYLIQQGVIEEVKKDDQD
jgi:uncharacterized protein YjbJ (UPF0337 family)